MITTRPWGEYQSLYLGSNFQVKRITVNPQSKLSLQFHEFRSEHWVVTDGTIVAQIGEDFHQLNKNQSIYIPKRVKHRIINNGDSPATLTEIQIGDYLGEDDITRLEDDYGRA